MTQALARYRQVGTATVTATDPVSGKTFTSTVTVVRLPPELPRITPDMTYPTVTGTTYTCSTNTQFQNALSQCSWGDAIEIVAGSNITGNWALPYKSGWAPGKYILIRTQSYASLPTYNGATRVDPSYAGVMGKFTSTDSSNPVIYTAYGVAANGWWLDGLEICPDPTKTTFGGLLGFGDGSSTQNTVALVPQGLRATRCYIHGQPGCDATRGIALNSADTGIAQCYISDIHSNNNDCQAIAGWNGGAGHLWLNCYLEASGENTMLGGASTHLPYPNQITDLTVRGCHYFKPDSWNRNTHGTYGSGGTGWEVKNLLEFKMGQRILIDGCVFENCWTDAQNGFGVLFKSVDQNASSPWIGLNHLTMQNCRVRNVTQALNINGNPEMTENGPAMTAMNIKIVNVVWEKIGPATTPAGTGDYGTVGGAYRWLEIAGAHNVSIRHNTAFSSDFNSMLFDPGQPQMQGFDYSDNLCGYDGKTNQIADGNSIGTAVLNTECAPGWVYDGNTQVGVNAGSYPPGVAKPNNYPATLASVQLNADLSLAAGSPYKGTASDGTDPGADIASINAATAGVVQVHG